MAKYYFPLFFVFFFLNNIYSQTTAIPDVDFEQALITLGIDKDGIINHSVATSDITGVTNLAIYNKNISDLTGIEGFTSLIQLNCGSNQITSLDIGSNLVLERLYCANNTQLQSLDLSKNTALTLLVIGNSNQTSLDVSQNILLDEISCQNNQLTTLDLSKNTVLTRLICENNQLTSLDLSQNLALKTLQTGNNPLTTIDVTKNTALEVFSCYSNQLTSIDVSKNTVLTTFRCYSNQLTNLDLTNNISLNYLDCKDNLIPSLDLSLNTSLTGVNCSNNLLTDLDVKNGNNINFFTLSALDNPNLICINVDDADWSTNNWTNIDSQSYFSVNCTLGVEDELLSQSINFYPNPVTNVLNIDSEITLTKVEIYSMLGKKVKEINSDFNSIPTDNFSDGVFIVRINSENGTTTKILIKN